MVPSLGIVFLRLQLTLRWSRGLLAANSSSTLPLPLVLFSLYRWNRFREHLLSILLLRSLIAINIIRVLAVRRSVLLTWQTLSLRLLVTMLVQLPIKNPLAVRSRRHVGLVV